MADLTITSADVASVIGLTATKTAGVAVAAGQVIYLDSTTSTMLLADADTEDASRATGIALNSAAAGQPVTYQSSGTITIGATVVTGKAYYVSTTAGSICLETDLSTGDFPTLLGFAISTTAIAISISQSGIAKA